MTAKEEYLALADELRAAFQVGNNDLTESILARIDGPWGRMTPEERDACWLEVTGLDAAGKEGVKL